MKIILLISLIAAVISPLRALAAPKILTVAIIQEWSAFNPITSQLASNEAIFPFIQRRMVLREVDGRVVADIAAAVPSLKKNKATWTIKPTAKWADGTPVTCADWHLGWRAGLNPKTSVETRLVYTKIKNIEWSKDTPRICNVTYTKSDWSYDRDLPPLLPSHIELTVFNTHQNEAEGYDRNTTYISASTNPGLYNGPYYVSEFKLGSHIILQRNPHFYGKTPEIEKVIFKHISDTSALKANLLSGQINAISAVGFPPDTALMMSDEFKQNSPHQVRFQNSGIFQGIYFNLDNSFLKDPLVREALHRAVDKEKIVAAFFNNNLHAAHGILSPQHPAYQSSDSIYSKKTANELLDKSGWKKQPDGTRMKSGKKLAFTFKTSAGLKVLENIQLAICSDFKSVGITCIIKNEPPRILLGRSVPRGDFDLAMYGQPIPADSSISSYFASKEIPTAKNSWAGGNAIRLNSSEVDSLLNQFEKENDRSKRDQAIRKINDFFQKNHTLIPLYHRREAVVVPKGLSGLKDSYDGTSFAEPENWAW